MIGTTEHIRIGQLTIRFLLEGTATAGSLAMSPDAARTYLRDGKSPAVGEVFSNPELAASYRRLATEGRDAFYKGDIARQICEYSAANGGFLTSKDFEAHTSDWVSPVSTNYRGFDVWELPPNGQGIAVLQMLNILEAYDLSKMGPGSADYLHLLTKGNQLRIPLNSVAQQIG